MDEKKVVALVGQSYVRHRSAHYNEKKKLNTLESSRSPLHLFSWFFSVKMQFFFVENHHELDVYSHRAKEFTCVCWVYRSYETPWCSNRTSWQHWSLAYFCILLRLFVFNPFDLPRLKCDAMNMTAIYSKNMCRCRQISDTLKWLQVLLKLYEIISNSSTQNKLASLKPDTVYTHSKRELFRSFRHPTCTDSR